MARYEEISLILPDGYRAYGRYWPAERQRGVVLYHHGIQSHCGWYEASAERLADAGYAVLQVDRRGCGRNPVDRGHADSADQLIADAHAARDELTRRSGSPRHHVVGVSWGGKLVVAAFVADPTGVQSMSLVTPGLFPQVGVTKSEAAKIGFAMLYEPLRLFDIPLDDAEFFTSVPRWQAFINTDALTLRRCTASFYLGSRRMDRIVARLGQSDPVPTHLLLAGEERIIDNEKTADFAANLKAWEFRITRYPRARHSLEFEEDRCGYLDDLVQFIDKIEYYRPQDCPNRTGRGGQ
ncbi:MAG: lysophospholipase [Planctomycetes bacterium]|nr:lysophospholipase [Planctomycetota bacterium]